MRIMRIYEKEQAIVGATEKDRDKNKERRDDKRSKGEKRQGFE